MNDFYQQMVLELAKQPIVLATVIQASGSVPSRVGTKLFVCADRKQVGTIDIGTEDAKIRSAALQVLATGINSFVEIDLSQTCGGQIRVWLERWDKKLVPLVQQILIALETETPSAIVTPFDQVPYLLPEAIASPALLPTGCFVEPLEPMPTLLIVGAGQVAVLLAQLAHAAEFQVMVVDDRAGVAAIEQFPPTTSFTSSIELVLPKWSQARARYVALMAREIDQEVSVLSSLLAYPIQYIGMMGSQYRKQQVCQKLIEQGHSLDQLSIIRSPIGIDISAQTPIETAISICAELIQIRRSDKTRRLNETAALD